MRAVMLEVPESLLAERRRRGADRRDEMWEGTLHMVPPPGSWHQELCLELGAVLLQICRPRGLRVSPETGLFRADDDDRVPDLVVSLAAHRTQRGVEGGAELVVEILSPHDETQEKLPFYAAFGVRELLVVHPWTRAVELRALQAGGFEPVAPDAAGRVRSCSLEATFATVGGPKLEVVWSDGTARI